ncbi:flagellar biosynthesis protein FlhB [Aeromonas taiwanensis]|uniref:Flagellar biosynthetic protein FlhB n=1 Tax=Aeromonas taiwanensis TaxID=633417 RepID=A0A5F0KES1_9GAMM|nr:flagellar biosynthesis protein FlhB [Aeromonas taiwanensis]TFF79932.1 flagellar biosynthesis protein FlhB [Aeromonas taiwanensis]TFF81106.1 flagellar biosynthesis protein FlhB [Aeromonas taiwanensis]TFF83010.1 flagellar biosynthesis protein FlhB [Aeromonas taiwanensis]
MSQHSAQDKTEEASSQKLRKAREEGQIARSKELSSAGLLLIGGLAMQWMVPSFGLFFAELMKQPQRFNWQGPRDPQMMIHWTADALIGMLWVLLPLFGLLALLLVLLGAVPGGMVLVWKKLMPSGEKLNPLKGLKRMFSTHSLMELLKSLLKVLLIGGTLALMLEHQWPTLMMMNRMPPQAAMEQALRILSQAFILLGSVQMLIAVLDVPYQRWSLNKQLKMTKQEVKDEHKNSEGRPEIKARIRQVQGMLARARIEQRVPQADVIIVNPTHYAVAIKYDPERANAPYVIAKGVDSMAERIREVAGQHGKMVMSLPELTRAIYYSTRVDQEVPAGLYTAVAYVLNHVLQLRAYEAGKGKRPNPLAPLHVPPELRQPER